MSCPLLEKLAPETRNLIYEYVLTFDNPIKHAQKMKPFIKKLYQSSHSETETASNEGPSHSSDSLRRVDTALLSTSRLIFKEAIAVFYENNTIYLDAEHCEAAHIVAPLATDLSLATHVMMKITGWEDGTKSLSACDNGIRFVLKGIPAIFTKLRTAEIYMYTDNSDTPVKTLFALAALWHGLADVVFDGVGSFTACSASRPGMDVRVQCKRMMERWAREEEHGFSWSSPLDVSARSVYPPSQDGHVNPNAIQIFNQTRRAFLPEDHPEVAEDSFEFWTIVDEVWHHTQLSMQHTPLFQDLAGRLRNLRLRQATTPSTQPTDAGPETSSSKGSGGEDHALKSSERQPELEHASAENGADD